MNVNATVTNTTAVDQSGDILICANLEVLAQLSTAITTISDEVYTYQAGKTSSIGMHIRHILEFYQAFLKTAKQPCDLEICYDNRQRDVRLETSKSSAIEELNAIKDAIMHVPTKDTALALSVIITPSNPLISVPTTLHRELYHVLDHMIHHMALIKLVAERQNVIFAENFGLARATQAHEGILK